MNNFEISLFNTFEEIEYLITMNSTIISSSFSKFLFSQMTYFKGLFSAFTEAISLCKQLKSIAVGSVETTVMFSCPPFKSMN